MPCFVHAFRPSDAQIALNKGGKVILYHGGSDPLSDPFRSTWFYEELASLRGPYRHTQDSARLFIVPGMGHCGGGVAPNSFDTLQALDNWVTSGVALEAIVATATAPHRRTLEVGKDGKTADADTATALQYLYEAVGWDGQ
jgi:Tannase and feruloyl esterase